MDKSIIKTDEYQSLVEETKAIISETKFSAEMTIVEGKHELGKRISEDKLYKKYSKGNRRFLGVLAVDIGLNERSLYECVRFYEKFPDVCAVVQTLGDGKGVKWGKIRPLLTEKSSPCEHPKTETYKVIHCLRCGWRKRM